ncbi:MAG: ATP-binding protein [bacterium]|nr:ATP-binding protein [bacterium]
MGEIFLITLGILGLLAGFIFYKRSGELEARLKKREKEIGQRIFELSILKELGDRIGYSLDVNKIIDIITGSLHQLIEYSAVSYMLVGPEKILFKSHLEKSVNRKFIDDIRDRMLASLSALLGKNLTRGGIEENISGAILVEEFEEPVRSFFNIPIVIGGKVMGILTVAHTKSGLYKEDEMTMLYRIMQQASSAVTRLEEVVQSEQLKLSSMVQSMTEGVVMTDKEYRVLVANPAARIAVGINLQKQDISIFDFIDGLEGKFDIRGRLEESVKQNKVIEMPEILLHDRFFQIFVAPVISTLETSEGQILGAVTIFHDITHEKEVEKLREDFTSIMVHELRSPLDSIKKRIEILEGAKPAEKTQDKISEIFSIIYKNSSHMLELVNDLLDAAKLEAGKFEFHKEPSDIKKLIEDRVNFFGPLAKDQGVELNYQLADTIPDKVNLDPLRIEQALNNLISNGIKFTDTGGKVTVQALLHKKGGDIIKEAGTAGIEWLLDNTASKLIGDIEDSTIIAVTDTGIGISGENIKQLFNKFKQFQSVAKRTEKKGTGLGLVIAKGIVEGHNGLIGIASQEGKGSTFYFTIPL